MRGAIQLLSQRASEMYLMGLRCPLFVGFFEINISHRNLCNGSVPRGSMKGIKTDGNHRQQGTQAVA